MTAEKPASSRKTAIHLLIIVALGFLAYSNTFNAPFVFDDTVFVESSRHKDVTNIPSMFTVITGQWASRPLLHATLALDYYFGGMDTSIYHATNLALHLFNGILLYLLVAMTGRRLGYGENEVRLTAALSSLIFVLHPAQTETVTNIINRSMLLSTAFYLLGLILFAKAAASQKYKGLYAAGLFATAFLGAASRENFITFPIMLVLYDLFFIARFRLREATGRWMLYAPVLLACSYTVFLVLNHSYDKGGDYGKAIPPLNYALTQFKVHWTYLRLLILPLQQNLDYDYRLSNTLWELPTLVSFLGYIGLWGLALLSDKKKTVAAFGILWFLVTLLPITFAAALFAAASGALSLGDVIFEHRLYLPSAGIIVLFSAMLARLTMGQKAKRVIIPLLAVLVVALGGASYARNSVWADEKKLWEDVITKSSNKSRGYSNLGLFYKKLGLTEKAIELYNQAIALDPDVPYFHSNLGVAYMETGQYEKAIGQFERAASLRPRLGGIYVNLGIAYKKTGRLDKAVEYYEKALSAGPESADALYNLANAYMQQGRIDEAISHYEKAITLRPEDPSAHKNLAVAYRMKGLDSKAQEHFRIAEELKLKSRQDR